MVKTHLTRRPTKRTPRTVNYRGKRYTRKVVEATKAAAEKRYRQFNTKRRSAIIVKFEAGKLGVPNRRYGVYTRIP